MQPAKRKRERDAHCSFHSFALPAINSNGASLSHPVLSTTLTSLSSCSRRITSLFRLRSFCVSERIVLLLLVSLVLSSRFVFSPSPPCVSLATFGPKLPPIADDNVHPPSRPRLPNLYSSIHAREHSRRHGKDALLVRDLVEHFRGGMRDCQHVGTSALNVSQLIASRPEIFASKRHELISRRRPMRVSVDEQFYRRI